MSQRDEQRASAKFSDKLRQTATKKKQPKKKPAPKEDFSQAAVRIVREATESD